MKIATVILLLCMSTAAFSQQPGWLHKDLQRDSIFGVSTDQAYALLKGKKNKTVIVAVIDAGIDTAHEDLKSVLWVNPKEIKNNKKDDDHNQYTDDSYGWNFLGSAYRNVQYDNLELVRLIRKGSSRFSNLAKMQADNHQLTVDTIGLAAYIALKGMYNTRLNEAKRGFLFLNTFKLIVDTIQMRLGTNSPSMAPLKGYEPLSLGESDVKRILLSNFSEFAGVPGYMEKEWYAPLAYYKAELDYALNLSYDSRTIIGDDDTNLSDSAYGNANVTGPNADHGTHVAGIIAAVRNNGIGIDGVADNVRLMVIRAIPDGDERDKDVANAIRYAVDNGAKVINMSFGKPYSPYKPAVDKAVRYAMQHDVLLVHSAGNEGLDVDFQPMYPTKKYADGKGIAEAWIEVGASGPKDGDLLAAGFSNYGAATVDVFAPGEKIYSTVPGAMYAYHDGTSMAAPVVTGIAALLRSYFPDLTAVQIKNILLQSVTKVKHTVLLKGKGVNFSDLCASGGIINAQQAVKLALKFKN